jgi:predicted 3-demethylubiquinone-9 3-methyltransferase (glyoxalase superfamily)
MMAKMTTCLWFDHGSAREAAEFYASVFPDSHVGTGQDSPADNPSTRRGEEITVEFTVLGQSFVGLNGGSSFKPNEAVSFQVFTDTQVQGPLGLFVADRAPRADGRDGRPRA